MYVRRTALDANASPVATRLYVTPHNALELPLPFPLADLRMVRRLEADDEPEPEAVPDTFAVRCCVADWVPEPSPVACRTKPRLYDMDEVPLAVSAPVLNAVSLSVPVSAVVAPPEP